MNKYDRALEALEQEVHSKDGWLSDAQGANLQVTYDGAVMFNGFGSIDMAHMIQIVVDSLGD